MRLAAHPLLIHCLVSAVFICTNNQRIRDVFGGRISTGNPGDPGYMTDAQLTLLKSNDKAPRYETNNPASSCTNKLIGDSCALCVRNAHW